jgi:hypothetical protein
VQAADAADALACAITHAHLSGTRAKIAAALARDAATGAPSARPAIKRVSLA